jgi:hypothetical protein
MNEPGPEIRRLLQARQQKARELAEIAAKLRFLGHVEQPSENWDGMVHAGEPLLETRR